MSNKNVLLNKFVLYAVTDLTEESNSFLKRVERAYAGGVDILQLRSKNLSDKSLIRIGLKIRNIANKLNKLFFVNDRVDLAILIRADGVHLGQDDIGIKEARSIAYKFNKNLFIGKSTHSIRQARLAEKEGADYIGVGPVFSTPTKPGIKPVGLKLVKQVKSNISIPWVAIGGINKKNAYEVCKAGAKRVAVVRAIFNVKNSYKEAKELRRIITNE